MSSSGGSNTELRRTRRQAHQHQRRRRSREWRAHNDARTSNDQLTRSNDATHGDGGGDDDVEHAAVPLPPATPPAGAGVGRYQFYSTTVGLVCFVVTLVVVAVLVEWALLGQYVTRQTTELRTRIVDLESRLARQTAAAPPTAGSPFAPPPPPSSSDYEPRERVYYVQAIEVDWDYMPSKIDPLTHMIAPGYEKEIAPNLLPLHPLNVSDLMSSMRKRNLLKRHNNATFCVDRGDGDYCSAAATATTSTALVSCRGGVVVAQRSCTCVMGDDDSSDRCATEDICTSDSEGLTRGTKMWRCAGTSTRIMCMNGLVTATTLCDGSCSLNATGDGNCDDVCVTERPRTAVDGKMWYCSPRNDARIMCMMGRTTMVEPCSDGCERKPGTSNDECYSFCASHAVANKQHYCDSSSGSGGSTSFGGSLVTCAAGQETARQTCDLGCTDNGASDDECQNYEAPANFCAGRSAEKMWYCDDRYATTNGGGVGVRVNCQAGVPLRTDVCTNGCMKMPEPVMDHCFPTPGGGGGASSGGLGGHVHIGPGAGEHATESIAKSRTRIGTTYRKCVYRQYVDESFSAQLQQPRHFGLIGLMMRAIVGDTIRVVFRNNCTMPVSMHPHGLEYTKAHEGAPYLGDNLKSRNYGGDRVAPNGTYTYEWLAAENSGPGDNDPSSIVWGVHSHVDESGDVNAGLVAVVVVCRVGAADVRTAVPLDVDREFVLFFNIMDENHTPYIMKSIRRSDADMQLIMREHLMTQAFIDSNEMHAINGYVHANLPGLQSKAGENVRWYLWALGSEMDMHTVHWHGHTVLWNKQRADVIQLNPATTRTVDMAIPLSAWPLTAMLHCHLHHHLHAGMTALYRIAHASDEFVH